MACFALGRFTAFLAFIAVLAFMDFIAFMTFIAFMAFIAFAAFALGTTFIAFMLDHFSTSADKYRRLEPRLISKPRNKNAQTNCVVSSRAQQ